MTVRAMTTAEDSAQAFERVVASAQQELFLAVPHLRPETPLQIPELRARGLEVWADLLALMTRRGVRLRIMVADCDPALAPDRHRAAWAAASGFADVVQGDAQVICAAHGQTVSGLWAWRLRRRFKGPLAALQTEDPARLTALQRRGANKDAGFRPAEMPQSFALADGAACVLGGPDLALAIDDPDFCGALRGHFTDCWNAALKTGGQSLAAPALTLDTPRRPQSRADLRLLRSLSRPAQGFAPHPLATDHEGALTRLFRTARHSLLIRSRAFRHDRLARTLAETAQTAPDLQVILLLAPDDGHDWDAPVAAARQAQALNTLRTAFGDRLACIQAPDSVTTAIVADDSTALFGSAALTRRACRWNTEASALVQDPALATDVMNRIGAAFLGRGTDAANIRLAATWRATCPALPPVPAARVRSPLPDDLF